MELASQDHLLFKDNLVPRSQSSVRECRKRHFSLRGGGGGWGGGALGDFRIKVTGVIVIAFRG